MQRLLVGDIHGCWDEFQELLERAGIGDDDEIIAVGDVVDRGPGTVEVLDFFRSATHSRSVMGNHERKHVRSFAGEIRPALSQQISRRQFGEERYPDACAFMAGLPRAIELDEVLVVHGFYEPGVDLRDQRDTVVVGTLTGQRHLEESYDRPWYELYDGERPIVVGHKDILRTGRPYVRDDERVWGIDTGACRGGRLTGLLLPEFRVIQVGARARHWKHLKREHADLRYDASLGEKMAFEKLDLFIAATERRDDLTEAEAAEFGRLRDVVARGRAALDAVYRSVLEGSDEILAALRSDIGYDDLDPTEQGRVYARRLGKHPLAGLYHQARRGYLDRAQMDQRWPTPRAALDLAERLGIEIEDESD